MKNIFLFLQKRSLMKVFSNECIVLKFISSESKLFRVIPKQYKKIFVSRLMKNDQKPIRLIPNESEASFQSESTWARNDPNLIFNQNQSEWIRGQNYSDWKFGLDKSELGLNWIEWYWFLTVFNQSTLNHFEWISIRYFRQSWIGIQSVPFRTILNHCESIQTTLWISFNEKRSKINPTYSDSFRMNPNQAFYPNQSALGLIKTEF